MTNVKRMSATVAKVDQALPLRLILVSLPSNVSSQSPVSNGNKKELREKLHHAKWRFGDNSSQSKLRIAPSTAILAMTLEDEKSFPDDATFGSRKQERKGTDRENNAGDSTPNRGLDRDWVVNRIRKECNDRNRRHNCEENQDNQHFENHDCSP